MGVPGLYNRCIPVCVDAITQEITTVVGGSAGYGGDCDNPTASTVKLKCADVKVNDNGDIYIADYINHRIRLVCNVPVVVNNVDKELESKLFPNPTHGQFTIQTSTNTSLISVYNIACSFNFVVYSSQYTSHRYSFTAFHSDIIYCLSGVSFHLKVESLSARCRYFFLAS